MKQIHANGGNHFVCGEMSKSDEEINVSIVESTQSRADFLHGSPMPGVDVIDDDDWRKFKRREMQKFEKCELPEITDNEFILNRDDHYANVRNARRKVLQGLDEINADGFLPPLKDGFTVKINDKVLPEKACKAFKKWLEKEYEKKPTDAVFEEDEIDRKFEKNWKKKREEFVKKGKAAAKFENAHQLLPIDEFQIDMETEHREAEISEKAYVKWLKEKVREAKADFNSAAYKCYLNELAKIARKKEEKESNNNFKKMVKKVQRSYKSLRSSSREALRRLSRSSE